MRRNRLGGLFTLPNGLTVPTLVRSLQYGTVSCSSSPGTATINSINTARAFLIHLGNTSTASAVANREPGRIVITNATTISGYATVDTPVVSFVVLELAPGVTKSIRTGTISLSGTSGTDTLSPGVNVSRSMALFMGYNGSVGDTATHRQSVCYLTLTDSTTVTATINTAPLSALTVGYTVVEWY